MKYKESKFNYKFEDNGKILIYNSRSNNILDYNNYEKDIDEILSEKENFMKNKLYQLGVIINNKQLIFAKML